jgi:hypothetical protein
VLKLAPRSFAAKRGTTISYTTSQDSTTTFSILKSSTGLKRGTRCVKAARGAKGKRCTLLTPLKPTFTRADLAGTVSFRFTARLGGTALRPGSYVLRATGANAKGKGNVLKAAFRIVRG